MAVHGFLALFPADISHRLWGVDRASLGLYEGSRAFLNHTLHTCISSRTLYCKLNRIQCVSFSLLQKGWVELEGKRWQRVVYEITSPATAALLQSHIIVGLKNPKLFRGRKKLLLIKGEVIVENMRLYLWEMLSAPGLNYMFFFLLQILNLFLALLLSSFAGQASLSTTQANQKNRILARLKKVVIASQFIRRIASKVWPKNNETSTESGQEGQFDGNNWIEYFRKIRQSINQSLTN